MLAPITNRWEVSLPASVISVAATPTLSIVAAACVDRKGYAFDHMGKHLWTHVSEHEIWATACSRDGNFIAFGTAEKKPAQGKVYILNREGNIIATFSIGMPVWSLDFDVLGTRLAVATWDGNCLIYSMKSRNWKLEYDVKLKGAGAYGVKWLGAGKIAVVNYGKGVAIISSKSGRIEKEYECDLLGYNLAVDNFENIYVGGRSGKLVKISGKTISELPLPSASRPIYAVATSNDGRVIFSGGADGYIRILDNEGRLLWEVDFVGELWSLSSSPSGRFLVAGCGDGRVVAMESQLDTDTMVELSSHLFTVISDNALGDTVASNRAVLDLLVRLNLFGYGLRFLSQRRATGSLQPPTYSELLEYLGDSCPPGHLEYAQICFERAIERRAKGHHWDAALMFLRASQDSLLRLRAFSEAATEFYKADHSAAALACFRRARESLLTSDDLKIIYTLARSFEDRGQGAIARDHLDMIMVQNTNYRDASSRLLGVRGAFGFDSARADYTGMTVNLLGPDGPTSNIDPRLKHILDARSKELNVDAIERDSYDLAMNRLFEAGILRERVGSAKVGYDVNSYVKYDYLLPEDDVKKRLEAINIVNLIGRFPNIKTSLDIGTATGRYPAIFKSMGIDAYGIDVEPTAIEYASAKFGDADRPNFQVGDARNIQFENGKFDLVTCMMGTFYHIPLDEQGLALTEMRRVCRPGGIAIISTWDIECPHLTFLSMYSVKEEELIMRNARRVEELEQMFSDVGFANVGTIRFALVPDTISYDLGIDNLDIDGLRRLLEIDVAARASVPNKHGQMFITYGSPPA